MLSRISEEVETSSCTSDHTYAEQSRAHLQNEIDALDVYDGWTSDDTDRSSFWFKVNVIPIDILFKGLLWPRVVWSLGLPSIVLGFWNMDNRI